MPSAVTLTLEALSHYPNAPLTIERRDTSIKIAPTLADSFEILVYDEEHEGMIAAERWHTHYEDPEQIAFCALWLLTPFYRVVQETKGGVLVAAWIERYEATGWEGFEPVYFLDPSVENIWRAIKGETFQRRYHQQMILPPLASYGEVAPGANLDEEGLPPGSGHGSWVVSSRTAQGPTVYRP